MTALHIIITDFNGYTQTRHCLEALSASHYRDFTITVVDHGTTEETSAGLAKEFPEATHLKGSPNLWWTGANNLGIQHALASGADAILLLNNDCYVSPDTVGILVELMQKTPNAIIASVQQDKQSGEIISISPRTCFLLGFPNIAGHQQLTKKMQINETLAVSLIVGGRGVIIPAQVFRQIGLLDQENLPHYGADHDFYLRARQQGFELCVATHAFVTIDNTRTTLAHDPGSLDVSDFLQSLTSIRSHRNLRDVNRLFRKHYPIPYLYPIGVALFFSRYVMVYWIKRAIFLLRGK